VQLGRIAAGLSVLLLGLGLVLAPGAVLGNLLSTTAESVTGKRGCCWDGIRLGRLDFVERMRNTLLGLGLLLAPVAVLHF
jgi:hypothetical protein